MAEEIKNAEIVTNPEFEAAMSKAMDPTAIKAVIAAEAAKQGIQMHRGEDGRFLPQQPSAVVEEKKEAKEEDDEPQETTFKDTFTIGGKEIEIEGKDVSDVLRQYKLAVQTYEIGRTPAEVKKEDVKVGLTADERVALEMQFKSGAITLEEYLDKTDAVGSYLTKKGIKVEDLDATLKQRVADNEARAWETATKEFIADLGADWPGGNQNLKLMGYKMAELGVSRTPSKESLHKAYDALKADNMIFTPEPTDDKAQEQGTTKQQTVKVEAKKDDPAPVVKRKATGSSSFGSGGNSGYGTDSASKKKMDEIDLKEIKKLSPREIMRQYNEKMRAEGKNPDDELAAMYGARRA